MTTLLVIAGIVFAAFIVAEVGIFGYVAIAWLLHNPKAGKAK